MKLLSTNAILACFASLSLCVLLASDAYAGRKIRSENKIDADLYNKIAEQDEDANRIVVPDSVKMLAKVSYLGILESISPTVPIVKYVKSDAAMEYINKLAYALTKKSILWPAIEVLAALVTAVSSIFFLIPSTYYYLETKYKTYEKYIFEGTTLLSQSKFEPEAIIEYLSRSSDDTLDRWGIADKSCRERSLCEIGDIVACYIPSTVSAIKKHVMAYVPDIDFDRNKYTRAFIKGLNNAKCGEIYSSYSGTCPSLHDWLGTYFWGQNPKRPNP